MKSLTVACVRTGEKYNSNYVARLAHNVRRNLVGVDRFICITDQPERMAGIEMIPAPVELEGWWAKMALFDPDLRGPGDCLYIDLDMIPIGDLFPLTATGADFATCANFARAAGGKTPCRFGSCVMWFAEGWGGEVWREFDAGRRYIIDSSPCGDQQAIEFLVPNAALFQDHVPAGFFLNYRALADCPVGPPEAARLAVFGGNHKPHNAAPVWLERRWQGL
jgi:hypothetical protein